MNSRNQIILGSKSPRRRQLLKLITPDFQVEAIEVQEDYPQDMAVNDVASYLAKKKALAYRDLFPNKIIITSDTTVILNSSILGKPESWQHGYNILQSLSGGWHTVNTGVTISLNERTVTISEFTKVHFPVLEHQAICDYLERFKPMDKAGAYGIQECCLQPMELYSSAELDFIRETHPHYLSEPVLAPSFTITKIEGSFFNVVGFPILEVIKALQPFL